MSWRFRYQARLFLRSTLWLTPAFSMLLAMIVTPLLHAFDERTRWALLGYGVEGARGVAGAIAASTFTLTVLIFSVTLVAVQLSSSQLSPRVIASSVLKDRQAQLALGLFVFTFILSVAVLGRIETRVPELSLLIAMIFSVLCIAVFLYLIDYVAKALRPVSVCGRIAQAGLQVIETLYPDPVSASSPARHVENDIRGDGQERVIRLTAASGVLLAFDSEGLTAAARQADGLIVLVPQVGDFVIIGEPLFRLFGGAASLKDHELLTAVALGPERTLTQDPAFALRILADIANKALSPGINDPTTAVEAIDYSHWLLREIGMRRLDHGAIRDETGQTRLIFRTPDWEDFVTLAVSETRLYGAGSLQIARRLRAMLQNLIETLPSHRHSPLNVQLDLLRRSVARSFADPEDCSCAGEGDRQGQGSAPDVGIKTPAAHDPRDDPTP